MARHSKHERERRSAETERVKQIEAAWLGSLPSAAAKAFAKSVAAARARAPQEKRPDMAPGHRCPARRARARAEAAQGRAPAPVVEPRLIAGPGASRGGRTTTTSSRPGGSPPPPRRSAPCSATPPRLARWWPSVYLRVRVLEEGDERGVGKVVDLWTKGFLPYTLRWRFTVTESDAPNGFRLEATGDFVGRGIWTLTPADDAEGAGRPADARDLRLACRGREGDPQDDCPWS